MGKIQQLSVQEARKIAAGEVIERPANVVKELLENALDAQATSITVYCAEGGKQLIRVVDNGCGMSADDAHLCFGLHTTSKIKTIDDLEHLRSFGFRGEALASISSVARITLITKEEESVIGTRLTLEHGEVVAQEQVACQRGTDIAVEDIFYTVPARKKFLKKAETEWNHIVQLFQAFCLSHKQVHFKLFHDDRAIYNCPPTEHLAERIAQLWDHTFVDNMRTIKHTKNAYGEFEGMISNHHYARYDRNNIFFFVNNRWIKNGTLSRALLKAYANVLPQGRYPAAALFLTVATNAIDVNIHPRKEEVQFLHPRGIETLIQTNAKAVLEQYLAQSVAAQPSLKASDFALRATTDTMAGRAHEAPFAMPETSFYTQKESPFEQSFTMPAQQQMFNAPRFADAAVQLPAAIKQRTDFVLEGQSLLMSVAEQNLQEYNIVGQFKKTYIMIEKDDGLFLVDQHAAHERILYERFIKQAPHASPVTLLFPVMVTLSQTSMQLLEPHLPLFRRNGIELELFGENTIIITAVPVHANTIAFEELLYNAVTWIQELETGNETTFARIMADKLCAQMACKAAVKAGDVLTLAQMTQLLEDLQETPNKFSCPHGRPTGWLLPLYEIEKKFKRVG